MFIISPKQAREFACMIYKDIRKFCEDHPEEFAAFLNNEKYTLTVFSNNTTFSDQMKEGAMNGT